MIICTVTILIGISTPISKDDEEVINRAKYVCMTKYPEVPCLKKLIKKEELVFHAICGAQIRE